MVQVFVYVGLLFEGVYYRGVDDVWNIVVLVVQLVSEGYWLQDFMQIIWEDMYFD